MLTHPTLDQLHGLGLNGMARAFASLAADPNAADLTHAEWLGLLLDHEVTDRQDRRLKARLRFARLRHQASIEDVDYRTARGLDRALFQALAGGRWIEEAQNVIIEGPTGVGKSWLACALGHKACRDNRSVLYQRIPRLFSDLTLGKDRGRWQNPRLQRHAGSADRDGGLLATHVRVGARHQRRCLFSEPLADSRHLTGRLLAAAESGAGVPGRSLEEPYDRRR